MGKKIVISFPGGRGAEIPLLYFGAKHYEDRGYEKIFINNPSYGEIDDDELLEVLLGNAKKVIESINLQEYDEIVFIGKSIGTAVACRIKEMFRLPAKLVLFTPIEPTLEYIRTDNDVLLVVVGTKDWGMDANKLKALCDSENVQCYVEDNVGHRMEVMNDLKRNLEIVYNVISRLPHVSD